MAIARLRLARFLCRGRPASPSAPYPTLAFGELHSRVGGSGLRPPPPTPTLAFGELHSCVGGSGLRPPPPTLLAHTGTSPVFAPPHPPPRMRVAGSVVTAPGSPQRFALRDDEGGRAPRLPRAFIAKHRVAVPPHALRAQGKLWQSLACGSLDSCVGGRPASPSAPYPPRSHGNKSRVRSTTPTPANARGWVCRDSSWIATALRASR